MAVLPPPVTMVLQEVDLLIGDGTADDFGAHVNGVTFTPSGGTTTWTGLKRNSHTAATVPTWTCNLEYAQDWESENSLSMYLFEHQGETVDVKFKPSAGGRTFSGRIVITPGAIGGQVNAYATASVTLGMDGEPVPGPLAGGSGS